MKITPSPQAPQLPPSTSPTPTSPTTAAAAARKKKKEKKEVHTKQQPPPQHPPQEDEEEDGGPHLALLGGASSTARSALLTRNSSSSSTRLPKKVEQPAQVIEAGEHEAQEHEPDDATNALVESVMQTKQVSSLELPKEKEEAEKLNGNNNHHHHHNHNREHAQEDDDPTASPLQQSPYFRFMHKYKHATTTGTTTALVADPWRWPVLVLFSMFSTSSAIQWLTYSTIAPSARQYFNLSTNQLNMLSSIYMITFVVGSFFACAFVERFGVRRSVLLCCALNTLGSLLKMAPAIQKPSYGTVMLAQTIASFSQLFILQVPPLIAAQYFPPCKRAFATAIMSTADNIGSAVALIVPPFIVTRPEARQFYILFGIELGYCGAILIGSIFFLRTPQIQKRRDETTHQDGRPGQPGALEQRGSSTTQDEDAMGNEEQEEAEGNKLGQDDEHHMNSAAVVSGMLEGMEPLHDELEQDFYEGEFQKEKAATTTTTEEEAEAAAAAAQEERGRNRRHGEGASVASTAHHAHRSTHTLQRIWYRAQRNDNVAACIHVARTIAQLLSQKDFVFLLCAFSVSMGSVWTYSSVLEQILEPYGLSSQMVGIAGALNLAAGTITAYLVGLFVDHQRMYKVPVIICLSASVLFCLALIIVMKTAKPYTSLMTAMCMFVYIFAGVFQTTAMPIAFEFAMEMTYPLPEGVPSGLCMAGANLVALIMLSVSSAMLGDTPSQASCVYVIVLITCVYAAGAILSGFPRETLYRHEAEAYAKRVGIVLEDTEANKKMITNNDNNNNNNNNNIGGEDMPSHAVRAADNDHSSRSELLVELKRIE